MRAGPQVRMREASFALLTLGAKKLELRDRDPRGGDVDKLSTFPQPYNRHDMRT